MPFNLRGGRPKNMGQGIYWVQRERASARTRVSGELQVIRFNARYLRITSQFLSVFRPYAGSDGTIPVVTGSKLNLSLDRYNDMKIWIDRNIDRSTNGDLSKLATAAKKALVHYSDTDSR